MAGLWPRFRGRPDILKGPPNSGGGVAYWPRLTPSQLRAVVASAFWAACR